jgi:hypothetical protein
MSDFVPVEKGVPIRFPSTANLLIASQDRYSSPSSDSAGSFTIQKNQSILNGFFSRVAPTEVTLQWCIPNVYDISGADPVTAGGGGLFYPANVRVDISGGSITNVKIPVGLYTIAEALDTIVARLNAASLGATFSITQTLGTAVNIASTVPFRFPVTSASGSNSLVTQLGFTIGGAYSSTNTIYSNQPELIGTISTGYNITTSTPFTSLNKYVYLDFVSNQLTYNQELKDTSTNAQTRDILFRWYLTQTPSTYPDKYGFPIYPSYAPYYERRPIAFPKQIKWSNNQPIGQLQFEVYAQTPDNNQSILLNSEGYDWAMTLLVSEV